MQSLFLLAIVPIILLLSYIKKKDPNPEPKDLLKKIFIFGCLSVIPVLICEKIYDDFFITSEVESFTDVFLGTALVEEFFKWIVIIAICFKSKHFDESYDAIVYSAYSSLAFACVENIGYVFLIGGVATGILRAFTAVPGHLCDGIIMGYFIGKARLAKANNKSAFPSLFMSLFLPTLIHCIYDYLLGIGEVEPFLIWVGFFITLVIVCVAIVQHSAKNNVVIQDGITATAPQSIPTATTQVPRPIPVTTTQATPETTPQATPPQPEQNTSPDQTAPYN